MKRPFIGITQGDPNGIGPEIIQKALEKAKILKLCRPVIVGELKHFKSLKTRPDISIVSPQKEDDDSGFAALELATELCLQKKLSAMVTAPINKKRVCDIEKINFLGHTDYLGQKSGLFYKKVFHPTMLFVGKRDRLALVTTHLPLHQVSKAVTQNKLKITLINVHWGLKNLLGVKSPALAILGLNPHAGEEGLLGGEEKILFRGLYPWAKRKTIKIAGPFSADSFFIKKWRQFDATVALYHDQGLIPFKTRNHPHSVNLTLGLPMIRTSVDHGVGYDIAHTGKADPASMVAAIDLAARLSLAKKTEW